MTKLLVETDTALPLVHVSVTAPNGSSLDPMGKEGLSRLCLRLMRRTAGGRAANEVDALIDQLGAGLGAEVSCSTAGLSGSVLSRNLDSFSELLRDALRAPGLAEQEFMRLKRETEAELLEVLDNDRTLARRWLQRRLFDNHPFGRSVAGTRASLEAISLADVAQMVEQTWSGAPATIALAGDVSAARAEAVVNALSDAAVPAVPTSFEEPKQRSGRHLIFVDKPERTQTQIAVGALGTSPRDDDHTALLVANTVFGGTFTSRLTQEVRAERGWSYSAYSSLSYDRARRAFSMWTFPAASDAGPCLALQLQLLNQWIDDGISADELTTAQNYLVRSNVFTTDTAAKRVGLRQEVLTYGLPEDYYSGYAERVLSVTREAANAAVRNRLDSKNLFIVVLGTQSDILRDIEQSAGDLDSLEIIPFDRE